MVRSALFLALAALMPVAAPAEQLPEVVQRAEVLPGWRTPEGTHIAALHLTLAPGWKTYWRAPGEAGIPPRFDWAGSENLANVRMHWPRPQLFELNGLTTVGYHDELILPLELSPRNAAEPIVLMADVEMGVCNEVCIPVSLKLDAHLTAAAGGPDAAIRAALNDRPEPAARAGVRDVRCAVEPIRDGMRLTASIDMPRLGADEFAVIEAGDPTIWVAEATSERAGGALTSVTDMVPSDAKPFAVDRSKLTITVFGDAGRVVEISGCRG